MDAWCFAQILFERRKHPLRTFLPQKPLSREMPPRWGVGRGLDPDDALSIEAAWAQGPLVRDMAIFSVTPDVVAAERLVS